MCARTQLLASRQSISPWLVRSPEVRPKSSCTHVKSEEEKVLSFRSTVLFCTREEVNRRIGDAREEERGRRYAGSGRPEQIPGKSRESYLRQVHGTSLFQPSARDTMATTTRRSRAAARGRF
ncbi:PREDICTED: uncharacterized protein LOC105570606 [Vollenhovia emeryi]|uniref:uncharacterized protein LOC105570606 n=1 Tax=Vollenhovia emeryi TaxID=411798 RepID=UPI0005F38677|nr:PREDICTED: uncharacterized protein LOC105570606 [Vollenhovia emeryi]